MTKRRKVTIEVKEIQKGMDLIAKAFRKANMDVEAGILACYMYAEGVEKHHKITRIDLALPDETDPIN